MVYSINNCKQEEVKINAAWIRVPQRCALTRTIIRQLAIFLRFLIVIFPRLKTVYAVFLPRCIKKLARRWNIHEKGLRLQDILKKLSPRRLASPLPWWSRNRLIAPQLKVKTSMVNGLILLAGRKELSPADQQQIDDIRLILENRLKNKSEFKWNMIRVTINWYYSRTPAGHHWYKAEIALDAVQLLRRLKRRLIDLEYDFVPGVPQILMEARYYWITTTLNLARKGSSLSIQVSK